jgi:hypothetical protein
MLRAILNGSRPRTHDTEPAIARNGGNKQRNMMLHTLNRNGYAACVMTVDIQRNVVPEWRAGVS